MFGTGFGAAYHVFAAYVMRHVEASRRGAAFGSIHTAFDTGMGSGSIASGWIVHGYGFEAAFAVAAALAAVAIPFFLFMDRRLAPELARRVLQNLNVSQRATYVMSSPGGVSSRKRPAKNRE